MPFACLWPRGDYDEDEDDIRPRTAVVWKEATKSRQILCVELKWNCQWQTWLQKHSAHWRKSLQWKKIDWRTPKQLNPCITLLNERAHTPQKGHTKGKHVGLVGVTIWESLNHWMANNFREMNHWTEIDSKQGTHGTLSAMQYNAEHSTSGNVSRMR